MIEYGVFLVVCTVDIEDDRLLTNVRSTGRGMDPIDRQGLLQMTLSLGRPKY